MTLPGAGGKAVQRESEWTYDQGLGKEFIIAEKVALLSRYRCAAGYPANRRGGSLE